MNANEIIVGSFNICNDGTSQKNQQTVWSRRMAYVIGLINTLYDKGVAVLALQELRDLDDEPTAKTFLSLLRYKVAIVAARDESKYAFGQAILYNENMVKPISSGMKRFYANDKVTWMPVWATFETELRHKFNVVNVHFPIDIESKIQACYDLMELKLDGIVTSADVYTGDFNTFPDDPTCCRSLLRARMDEVNDERNQHGHIVGGTFIGFEHDKFKAPVTGGESRLDNFFVKRHTRILLEHKTVWMVPISGEVFKTRDYPSDHFPVTTTIRFA